jgi:hypothetical protein
MRNIIILFFFNVISVNLFAQSGKVEDSKIPLSIFFADNTEKIGEDARKLLALKMNEIISQSGSYGSSSASRFILVSNIVEVSKDISTTSPIIYQYELAVSFYIGDGIEGVKYSTYSVSVKGNGYSETKAYIAALKQIKTNEVRVKQFVDDAKTKIGTYYAGKCESILRDATTLEQMKKFDEAIYNLTSVPNVCVDCYNKCMEYAVLVFKKKMEFECQDNLAKANALTANNDQTDEAINILSQIPPETSCFSEAKSLIQKIIDHKCAVLLGNAKGYWSSHDLLNTTNALKAIPSDSKCYKDALLLSSEVENYVQRSENRSYRILEEKIINEHEIQLNEQNIRVASIKATRDVGIAYAKNQPKIINNVSYHINGWW